MLSFFTLAGCTIHPVQRDVTGIRTADIVDRIRCETRLAIQDKAISLLGNLPAYKDPDGRARRIAKDLADHRGEAWHFDPRTLSTPDQRAFYNRYVRTGIAFDFTFDITEDNQVIAAADPIRLITNGTAGIGLDASGQYRRNNSRHFVVSDTFERILQSEALPCSDDYRSSNFAYPIAGVIGIGELIDTFIDLNEDKQLVVEKSNSRVFADTMTFTTTLSGAASPQVTLAPAGNRWGLTGASLTGSALRIDKHALIVGLSMEAPGADSQKAASSAPIPGLTGGRSALQKSSVTSANEQGALNAVTQQRIDTYLDRALPR